MGLIVLEALEETWQGMGVHGADINAASVLSAEEKPRHSNDPCLGASMSGSLMSALWTLDAGRSEVCRVSQRILPPSGPVPSPRRTRRPWARRRLRGFHPEPTYSTRAGIYWSRVVRTARRPHLPAVHPTLLQQHPTLVHSVLTTPGPPLVTVTIPLWTVLRRARGGASVSLWR